MFDGLVKAFKQWRRWQIGTIDKVGWIAAGTIPGISITAAIPPIFDAYATCYEPDGVTLIAHERALVERLAEVTHQLWWLGYLDTGPRARARVSKRLRSRGMSIVPRQSHMISRAAGITRSLVTYYGPVWRRRRFKTFYEQFLRPGDLAFDIGAHVGNRVHVFRRIGARVVAIEPQPDFVRVLRVLYGRDHAVIIDASGVAAESGRGQLHLSSRTPTVSTFADSWMNDVQADRRFQRIQWDTVLSVPLVTLDELIARYGEPQFCKIDVEGFEHEVLTGLSHPLPTLSFEYIPVAIDRAVACVARISALGEYRYRHSRVETHRWAAPHWLEPEAMIAILRAMPADGRSGDVYAVRTDRLGWLQEAGGKKNV